MSSREVDFLVVGAGIIGLSIARELRTQFPDATILIIEKEKDVGLHASGRNSGVLHAGFYYSADSLKAKFTKDGNKALTDYCLEHNLPINRCGKVVVARNAEELEGINELKKRGDRNGVLLNLIDEKELTDIEPNAKTYEKALYSPTTSTVDPLEVCITLVTELRSKHVDIAFANPFIARKNGVIETQNYSVACKYFINAAGSYADKVAHQFNVGKNYTLIPFKGLYLKYHDDSLIQKHIYPVPNLKFPFLGVHFTKTAYGKVKIGPTAVPAFWRENYGGVSNFKLGEICEVLKEEAKLFMLNSFNFRDFAFEEMKKYSREYFINQAAELVKQLDVKGFGEYGHPGIRAQLLDKRTNQLVQDFIVEEEENSLHVLNAVSPAFTCSLVFAQYIVSRIKERL